jgi:hypothetical protein
MSDPVIENAQQAANTPANQAPDERAPAQQQQDPAAPRQQTPAPSEARRKELNRPGDDGIWSTNPKKQAAARSELQRLMRSPDAVAAEEQKKTEADAALSPAEKKISELRKSDAFWFKNHPDHAKVMQEYRAALVAAETPEEQQALVAGGIEGVRRAVGLDAPQDIVTLGKDSATAYRESYAGHEATLLLQARAEGWDTKLAGDLRDHGVRLGLEIGARGTPMTADEVAAFKHKFRGRLTEAQADRLIQWFQQSVVGGTL